jgi:hypothetical protein
VNLDSGRLSRSPSPERCERVARGLGGPSTKIATNSRIGLPANALSALATTTRIRHSGTPGNRCAGRSTTSFTPRAAKPQQMLWNPIGKSVSVAMRANYSAASACRGSKESDILDAWADLLEEHSQTTSSALVACIVEIVPLHSGAMPGAYARAQHPARVKPATGGDFKWPPAETYTRPPVGTFSWPRTARRGFSTRHVCRQDHKPSNPVTDVTFRSV